MQSQNECQWLEPGDVSYRSHMDKLSEGDLNLVGAAADMALDDEIGVPDNLAGQGGMAAAKNIFS